MWDLGLGEIDVIYLSPLLWNLACMITSQHLPSAMVNPSHPIPSTAPLLKILFQTSEGSLMNLRGTISNAASDVAPTSPRPLTWFWTPRPFRVDAPLALSLTSTSKCDDVSHIRQPHGRWALPFVGRSPRLT